MVTRTAFLFDRMLGKLCRRMRLLGFDSELNPESEQGRFLVKADREKRLAVTMSRRKTDRPGTPPLVLRSRGVNQQVIELLGALNPTPRLEPFTRCLECNSVLEDLPGEKAPGRVPRDIIENLDSFKVCPGCRRVYWKGSHFEAMSRTIGKITQKLKQRE